MRDIQGKTLIELVVVLSIAVVLITALGFSFQGWMDSCRMEGEVKEMYVDLMKARARAMQQNRVHFMVIKADNYQIFEDTNDNNQYDAGTDRNAMFANPKTPTRASLWMGTVSLDGRGLVRPNGTIRFDTDANNLDYDCVVLFATRINMGKWDGTSCVAK